MIPSAKINILILSFLMRTDGAGCQREMHIKDDMVRGNYVTAFSRPDSWINTISNKHL